jgi:hypothetical protein
MYFCIPRRSSPVSSNDVLLKLIFFSVFLDKDQQGKVYRTQLPTQTSHSNNNNNNAEGTEPKPGENRGGTCNKWNDKDESKRNK